MISVFTVNINRATKYKEYLFLINGFLGLTHKDVIILSDFIRIMFETNEKHNIFSTEIRKEVAKINKIKNINTYVKKYVDMNLVTKKGENYYPIKLLIPEESGITFNFKWN